MNLWPSINIFAIYSLLQLITNYLKPNQKSQCKSLRSKVKGKLYWSYCEI